MDSKTATQIKKKAALRIFEVYVTVTDLDSDLQAEKEKHITSCPY